MPIRNWSTNPNANNSNPPNGFPENMAPSQLNNTNRQNMSDIRTWYEDAQWIDLGDTPSRNSASIFKITGDVTSQYQVNRRVKCYDATTLYGRISASTYGAPDTSITVVLDSGSLSTSLSSVAIGILSGSNNAIPANLGIVDLTLPGILSVSGAAVFKTTMTVEGTSTLSGAVTLKSTLNVEGNASLSGAVVVKGAFLAESTATISGAGIFKTALTSEGTTTLSGAAVAKTTFLAEGALSTASTFTASGAGVFKTSLNVEGNASLSGAAVIKGTFLNESAATFASTVSISGAAVCKTTLNIEGASTHSGAATFKSALIAESTVSISGQAVCKTGLTVEGVSTHSGAAVFSTTTNHIGAAQFGSTVSISAAAVCKAGLTVEGAATISGAAVCSTTLSVGGAATISGAATLKSTLAVTGAVTLTVPLALAGGGLGSALVDPNADRILFWDDSAGVVDWLIPSTGLNVTGTTLTVKPRGYFRAFASATTSVSNNTSTLIALATEDIDVEGWFASSRYTPQVAGWYWFAGAVSFSTLDAACSVFGIIRFNGTTSAVKQAGRAEAANKIITANCSGPVLMNGTTDFVELFGFQDGGGTDNNDIATASSNNWLSGFLLVAT